MSKTSKASLGIIFVTVFIDLLGFGIVLPLLPRYAEYFEAEKYVLGLLMASFSAMPALPRATALPGSRKSPWQSLLDSRVSMIPLDLRPEE